MPMTIKSTGLGRDIFSQVFYTATNDLEPYWKALVGSERTTTESSFIDRQMNALGPAMLTPEGEHAAMDEITPLYSREQFPFLVTLGTSYTELWDYTNQYADIRAKQPMFAESFWYTRNQVVADMWNLGFTNNTSGMNSEFLFSATHATGVSGVTQSNLSTDVLSPLALERAWAQLKRQRNSRNQVMPISGKLRLIVPEELYMPAVRYVEALKLATTNNNDPNPIGREIIDVVGNPFLTSTTAWFLQAVSGKQNKTYLATQLPYKIEQLAMGPDFITKWVARESYVPGWQDFRGLLGSAGT